MTEATMVRRYFVTMLALNNEVFDVEEFAGSPREVKDICELKYPTCTACVIIDDEDFEDTYCNPDEVEHYDSSLLQGWEWV